MQSQSMTRASKGQASGIEQAPGSRTWQKSFKMIRPFNPLGSRRNSSWLPTSQKSTSQVASVCFPLFQISVLLGGSRDSSASARCVLERICRLRKASNSAVAALSRGCRHRARASHTVEECQGEDNMGPEKSSSKMWGCLAGGGGGIYLSRGPGLTKPTAGHTVALRKEARSAPPPPPPAHNTKQKAFFMPAPPKVVRLLPAQRGKLREGCVGWQPGKEELPW